MRFLKQFLLCSVVLNNGYASDDAMDIDSDPVKKPISTASSKRPHPEGEGADSQIQGRVLKKARIDNATGQNLDDLPKDIHGVIVEILGRRGAAVPSLALVNKTLYRNIKRYLSETPIPFKNILSIISQDLEQGLTSEQIKKKIILNLTNYLNPVFVGKDTFHDLEDLMLEQFEKVKSLKTQDRNFQDFLYEHIFSRTCRDLFSQNLSDLDSFIDVFQKNYKENIIKYAPYLILIQVIQCCHNTIMQSEHNFWGDLTEQLRDDHFARDAVFVSNAVFDVYEIYKKACGLREERIVATNNEDEAKIMRSIIKELKKINYNEYSKHKQIENQYLCISFLINILNEKLAMLNLINPDLPYQVDYHFNALINYINNYLFEIGKSYYTGEFRESLFSEQSKKHLKEQILRTVSNFFSKKSISTNMILEEKKSHFISNVFNILDVFYKKGPGATCLYQYYSNLGEKFNSKSAFKQARDYALRLARSFEPNATVCYNHVPHIKLNDVSKSIEWYENTANTQRTIAQLTSKNDKERKLKAYRESIDYYFLAIKNAIESSTFRDEQGDFFVEMPPEYDSMLVNNGKSDNHKKIFEIITELEKIYKDDPTEFVELYSYISKEFENIATNDFIIKEIYNSRAILQFQWPRSNFTQSWSYHAAACAKERAAAYVKDDKELATLWNEAAELFIKEYNLMKIKPPTDEDPDTYNHDAAELFQVRLHERLNNHAYYDVFNEYNIPNAFRKSAQYFEKLQDKESAIKAWNNAESWYLKIIHSCVGAFYGYTPTAVIQGYGYAQLGKMLWIRHVLLQSSIKNINIIKKIIKYEKNAIDGITDEEPNEYGYFILSQSYFRMSALYYKLSHWDSNKHMEHLENVFDYLKKAKDSFEDINQQFCLPNNVFNPYVDYDEDDEDNDLEDFRKKNTLEHREITIKKHLKAFLSAAILQSIIGDAENFISNNDVEVKEIFAQIIKWSKRKENRDSKINIFCGSFSLDDLEKGAEILNNPQVQRWKNL